MIKDEFKVRRIYCVGRNYSAHAEEMGFDSSEGDPFFFLKPGDSIVQGNSEIPYPLGTANFHHEVELVVAIGKQGVEIDQDDALDHVFGYAVGLDLTRRDLQISARDASKPWDIGKSFDFCAACSSVRAVSQIGHPTQASIWLTVNGEIRQSSNIKDMIWSVPEIIAFLSRFYWLKPGDLIFMGTPEGVGPLVSGDLIAAGVEGVGRLEVKVI